MTEHLSIVLDAIDELAGLERDRERVIARRDSAIRAALLAGHGTRELARATDLTPSRISQISQAGTALK